ncbi:hypothetical protein A3C20_02380 [Candidatus Kaiserbacteria bacterium RIFCSPHIGHO2_02_FULL_55_25]|uniref:Fibronectin type-III domain-containing protein n=2 Tax=Parcubacteria group TaxID=1794811 RepID=A0A1F4Y0R2_9BACT|nr:MAG: hypothetical protein A3B33_02380 [Candidatus Adlerbacteria bacterium RIFCSPLOWO2_01_FULL_54_16]OGG54135.1 MAG: hypothetical protein A2764_00865 [Candidatus Kaiserbacteria bacterium RIFCSPHIGHO2_01_FULL_55_79]OGG69833.1 MAG: hypothetical protein A3C20_02380 [Candidatus Kaiserbacteria bacterium RIFCSPHIGHO2_02_FULL_55_25]OGG78467.1 MAG: hypothetical protein A3F56_04075 [Candidatus Kaiserbacteria bacterium RIFCSPHIGHO2_12_FULL_55_13]
MNQNWIIGIILVLVIVGGGYVFLNMNAAPVGPQATTTPTTTIDDTQNPSPASSAGKPSVVTDTTVSPTNSTAVVTGKVTPNGSPTSYWYEYGQSATLGSKTAAQAIGSGYTAIAAPGFITGLAKDSTFYFRLSAQNAYGTVTGGTYSFTTNNNPPSQGTAPAASTNSATAVARTSATLNAHVTPRSSQTTYWFEYGDSTDFGSVSSFQSAGSGNTSLAVSSAVAGLSPQTKYYFRVNAQNQYGTTNGSTQNFTTPGPAFSAVPVVTSQVASPVATTTATLRGTVNPSGSQTTYWFEYSTNSLFASASLKTTSQRSAGAAQGTVSVQSDVISLRSDTTYYFRVVAQNAGGTVRSGAQTFTTK